MEKFNLGGTADSSESGGANIGGTLGSSIMKNGGVSDSNFERDYKKVKNHIKEGYGYIDSGYVETTWENLSNITYSAIEDKLIKRLKKDSLYKYSKGGSLKGKQKNLDLNKNGKLDSEDFKMLKGKKKGNGGGTGVSSQTGFAEGTNADLVMNQDYLAYKKGGSVKVGDKVMLPEIKMRDGKIQFEEVENGKVLSIENGIYDVLNPKTNRIHRVTLNQIKYANGGGLADVPESFPETDAMSYKKGGGVGTIKERVIDYYINNSDNEDLINLMGVSDVPNLKQVAEKWVNNRDSYYDKIFSAIDGIHNRTWAENKFEELGLEKLANGGSTKGFEYSIGGL